ncbi:MAG TPA: two-component system response regulator [Clostridiaceae bacterium]|jgi:two-component system CitB family response regulator|nr:two-component system response regulator [Clostridiaceae bacterium]HBX48625.1 two-component system response regulator [Clostridiaceae bacterium]
MIEVMIVEDDPMVAHINSKFLEKIDGFHLCNISNNLSEAKDFVSKMTPDLILLDIFLPRENGISFLKWIRKEDINSDVILITADKNMDSVKEAFRYGAVDYLIKPFDFERFKDALLQFEERHKSFNKYDIVEQNILDKCILTSSNENYNDIDLEKGLNPYTYDKIWKAVETFKNPFTAEEIADKTGMARVTVRRYLEYMQREDRLRVALEYGKVGRPSHKYIVN